MSNDTLELPAFLRIPQEDRRAAWIGRKLTKVKFSTKVTRDEDASTRAFRRAMEKQAQAKKQASLKLLRERYGKH